MKKQQKMVNVLGAFAAVAVGGLALGGNVFADTTYTSENFPDSGFFYCVKSGIEGVDPTTATSITQAQAEGITNLSCDGTVSAKQFTNATGLELLTNLEGINIENQTNLQSLDLSHNEKLTGIVSVMNNPQLATLNFGQNSTIQTVFANNNVLESIDVSGLTGLTQLHVYNNKLTSLNVSSNTALTNLVASKNKLAGVDLSANRALTIAYLYDNEFESIDVSRINKNLLGLYLDDNVLVRTNFVAVQIARGENYYASVDTNGGTDGMFIPMMVMTGLGRESRITTSGASFHNNDGNCFEGDAFCIVIDADILDYQNYVQLAYVGETPNATMVANGQDESKLNYRLEINLQAYQEGSDIRVPDTGVFSGGHGEVMGVIISLGAIATIAGIVFGVVYSVRRNSDKVGFTKKGF
ncbi:hypothetical protein J6X04_02985 [Candidatus Saccharibacteria bacterium]|nr:hypothetical protein [Candidatus Saccharibacteria bacterium]